MAYPVLFVILRGLAIMAVESAFRPVPVRRHLPSLLLRG